MNTLQKALLIEARKHINTNPSYAHELLEEVLSVFWNIPSGFLQGSLYKDDIFHGSDRKFKEGEKMRPDAGPDYGMYFSTKRTYAKRYGKYLYRCLINIKNPIIVKDRGELPVGKGGDLTKQDAEKLIKEGYDSVVVTLSTIEKAVEIIVFDPDKVFIHGTNSF